MSSWQCPLCKGRFVGMTKSAHQQNFYKEADDMTRCDNVARSLARFRATSCFRVETSPDGAVTSDSSASIGSVVSAAFDSDQQVGFITTPHIPTLLHELARRPRCKHQAQRADRYGYSMRDAKVPEGMMPRDMVVVMEQWQEFQQKVQLCCSEEFWRFFLALHEQPGVAIDAALANAKEIFLKEKKGTPEWTNFPGSRRILFRKVDNLGADFFPQVLHSTRINLSQFELPKPVAYVDFKFVDPVFAWIVAAQRQRADDMHFQPSSKRTPSGIPLYGGGIQQGLAFKEACRSCPSGSQPMCFSLHWDGTSAHGVSAAPICVGVSNTNNAGPSAQFCLGYMPHIAQQGKSFYATTTATKVKFHIRQQCVAAILRVLETAAVTGVICPFKNCHGQNVSLLLMPRLLTVPVDQPEAQLFYGMKNRWSCSKCKRREGYSAFRKASMQDGETVQCLYRMACDSNSRWQTKAKTMLKNYGFNPSRLCVLPSVCDELLVHIPYIPRRVEVFPCIDYRDKMHGIFIFLHKRIMDALNQIAWKVRRGPKTLTAKQLLDQRSTLIGYSRSFRCVETGRSLRVQKSIFNEVNMSATDKWVLLFLLPHVFGHKGEFIPENVRLPMLTAIARAQLIILASRGRREYTKSELSQIYDNGYVEVFKALEYINHVHLDSKYDAAFDKHAQNPRNNPPPKRFKSLRYDDNHALDNHPNLLP